MSDEETSQDILLGQMEANRQENERAYEKMGFWFLIAWLFSRRRKTTSQ